MTQRDTIIQMDAIRHEEMTSLYQVNHDETRKVLDSLSFSFSTYFSSDENTNYIFRKNLFMKEDLVDSFFYKLLPSDSKDFSYIRHIDADLVEALKSVPRDEFTLTPNHSLTSNLVRDKATGNIGITLNPLLYPELFNKATRSVDSDIFRDRGILSFDDIDSIMHGNACPKEMHYTDGFFFDGKKDTLTIILWETGEFYAGKESEDFEQVFVS